MLQINLQQEMLLAKSDRFHALNLLFGSVLRDQRFQSSGFVVETVLEVVDHSVDVPRAFFQTPITNHHRISLMEGQFAQYYH